MIREANYYGIMMLVTPHDDDVFYVFSTSPTFVTNIDVARRFKWNQV